MKGGGMAHEGTLGALREGLAGARGEWQYLTTLLDARNAAAARAREARARSVAWEILETSVLWQI